MKILVSSPDSDNITRYLYAWTKKLIAHFRNKHDFIHLESKNANRKHFCGVLEKGHVDIVLINGHGSTSSITGYNQEVLINRENVSLLKNKTVHALSCQTAKELGPLAMSIGVKGYIGYDEKFVLIMRNGGLSNPLDDDLAKLFLDPAFIAPKGLLNGKTPSESVDLAIGAYKRSITHALNSDIQSDQEQCVPYLIYDLMHIKAFE